MAIRSNGSLQSNDAGAAFPPKKTPGPISTFSATPASATQMNTSWSAPTDIGSDAITGYKVEYCVTSVGTYTTFAANQAGTSANITGLTNGTNYTFRITPINSVGNGQSNTFTATLKYGLGTLTYSEFTSSGTWTCPAGVTKVNLMLLGGGGGGSSSRTAWGGVPSDVKVWFDIDVTPSTGYTVTIGARGSNAGDGSGGGSTSITIGATTYTSQGGAPANSGPSNTYYDTNNYQSGTSWGGWAHISGNTRVGQPGFKKWDLVGSGWGLGAGDGGYPFNGASNAPQQGYWHQPVGGSNYGAGYYTTAYTGSNPPGGSTGQAASGYGTGGSWYAYGGPGLARIYYYQ